jgi:hypothetical protein
MAKRHVVHVWADASAHAGGIFLAAVSSKRRVWNDGLSKGLVLAASFSTRESASYASMLIHAKPLVSQNGAGSLRRLRSANG